MKIFNKINKSIYYILPYVVIILIFISVSKIRGIGDSAALISGINEAILCINKGGFTCNAGVIHFPIFQYIIGLPLKLAGLTSEKIIEIFSIINTIAFMASLLIFRRAIILGSKSKAAGHLATLFLLSGYIIWYVTASFNESTAFLLFSGLTYSIISNSRPIIIAMLAFLCTLTKEIAFPFVIYSILLAHIVNININIGSYRKIQYQNLIKEFIKKYWYLLFTVLAGVFINCLFNMFRYGSIKNKFNLATELHTPSEYIYDFFLALFISPAGGLIFTWFSMVILMVIPLITKIIKGKDAIIIIAASFGIILLNIGLAMWYSPFGWIAWGPRLTLPFLGTVGILLMYILGKNIDTVKVLLKKLVIRYLVFAVLIVSALPNFAVVINEGAFFQKMFAPTQIEKQTNIIPFTVQTASAEQYMQAAVEIYHRQVIIPTTITIINNNKIIFILLCFSLFAIFKRSSEDLIR